MDQEGEDQISLSILMERIRKLEEELERIKRTQKLLQETFARFYEELRRKERML